MNRKALLSLLMMLGVALSAPAQTSTVTVEKPYFRWLFGGFGFQHSEANFGALMSDEFKYQRALKAFAEISPSFGRVYTGFADQSHEQMDRFADYYSQTFAKAGTILYAVPGALVCRPEDDTIKPDDYAEKVAVSLDYLVKEKGCRSLRYYCLSNELMAGDRWGWFDSAGRMDLFKTWNIALYNAFRRHGLDLLLIGSDKSAMPDEAMEVQKWVADNMDDWLGAYVTHWYVYGYPVDRLDMWETYHKQFEGQVQLALSKGKRYILGEYGYCPVFGGKGVMIDDVGASFRQKETAAESALCKCEVGLAAMNAGAYGCISWSFLDYPDPFNREDGNSEMDHARYEAGLCAYRPDLKYNKWGMIHWSDVDRDYSATPELYSLGYLAKFFRKGATVLKCASDNPLVRTGAVIYPDRSFCIALINRGEATDVTVDCSSWALDPKNDTFSKSARRYVYEAANPPFNEFNDLQPCSGTVTAKDGKLTVKLPAHSMTFLTTDYTDRTPSRIGGVKVKDGKLVWNPCSDKEHRYYRVFRDGKQIASTVATELALNSAGGNFTVKSVDAWGNVGD